MKSNLGAILIFVILALMTPRLISSAQTDREITAERITIKDKAGNTRASLNESGLAIFDTARKIRVGVGTMSDGTPFVSLYEKTGELGALMRVNGDGSSQLQLTRAGAKAGVVLTEKGSGFTVWDQHGKPRIRISVGIDEDGSPGIMLLDELRPRFAINFGGKAINVSLLGIDSKPKLLLSVSMDGSPSVSLLDRNGSIKNKVG